MNKMIRLLALAPAVFMGACGIPSGEVSDADTLKVMKASFVESGQVKLDRLEQSELQRQCTAYARSEMPKDLKARLEKAAMATIQYPADGKYLGDWKKGEKIAQYGRGGMFSDKPGARTGGNCYACHQLRKEELSYGTLGPSLYNYGKLRGTSEAILKYTWGRLWNGHAFNACNNMPRFGQTGVLSQAQLRDVMALLLDPASPVNK